MLENVNPLENISVFVQGARALSADTHRPNLVTPSLTSHEDRKRKHGISTEENVSNTNSMASAVNQDIDDGFQLVGSNKPKKSKSLEVSAPDTGHSNSDTHMETPEDNAQDQITEVRQNTTLAITFIENSKTENLIYDVNTVRALLNKTLFKNTYEGTGRALHGKHQLILNIKPSEEKKNP